MQFSGGGVWISKSRLHDTIDVAPDFGFNWWGKVARLDVEGALEGDWLRGIAFIFLGMGLRGAHHHSSSSRPMAWFRTD